VFTDKDRHHITRYAARNWLRMEETAFLSGEKTPEYYNATDSLQSKVINHIVRIKLKHHTTVKWMNRHILV